MHRKTNQYLPAAGVVVPGGWSRNGNPQPQEPFAISKAAPAATRAVRDWMVRLQDILIEATSVEYFPQKWFS
jgi:hypothetical protein